MKIISPEQCISLKDVRASIDVVDYEIIKLFALRAKYVDAVVKFKTDEKSVVAIDRQKQVVDQVGLWAKEMGLNEDTFRFIYQSLIDINVAHEMTLLKMQMVQK